MTVIRLMYAYIKIYIYIYVCVCAYENDGMYVGMCVHDVGWLNHDALNMFAPCLACLQSRIGPFFSLSMIFGRRVWLWFAQFVPRGLSRRSRSQCGAN